MGRDGDQERQDVAAQAAACRLCAATLPLGPRPVFRISDRARILLVGQAPGTRVHETGIPWNDASGDRLRAWLAMDRERFYAADGPLAILPMGLCYPGREARGGDKPPRPECAPLWHPRFRAILPHIRLTVLLGQYALAYYLGRTRKRTLWETVRAWQTYLPEYFVLPHPSWRNNHRLNKDADWFHGQLLPDLRARITAAQEN